MVVNSAISQTQRKAAVIAGAMYLLVYVLSFFVQLYAHGSLIIYDDATATAQNIIAHKGLFRSGIVAELLTFCADIVLSVSLFVILRGVKNYLAITAIALRLVAAAVCVSMAADSFNVVRVLGGAEYLQTFSADQLAAMARLQIGAHVTSYYVGWLFLGLGSLAFCILWLESGYVPNWLSRLGICGSFLLAGGSLMYLLAPSLHVVVYPWLMVPMFLFEISMGLWLLLKQLQPGPCTVISGEHA